MRWSGVFSGKYLMLVVVECGADVALIIFVVCDGYNGLSKAKGCGCGLGPRFVPPQPRTPPPGRGSLRFF